MTEGDAAAVTLETLHADLTVGFAGIRDALLDLKPTSRAHW